MLFLSEVVYGQENFPPSQLLFNRLTVDQGLSEGHNSYIFKDSKGFVWISSTSGLNRFDGNEIKVYREIIGDSTSIKGANVNGCFSEDRNKNLWFTTYDALNFYDRKTDHFESYLLRDSLTGYFNCGLDSDGHLWLMHNNDLYKFNIVTKVFTFITDIKKGYQKGKIQCDQDGKIKRIFLYSGSKLEGVQIVTIKEYDKIQSAIYYPGEYPIEIKGLVSENDSTIWCATRVGLVAFNFNQNESVSYQDNFIKDGKSKLTDFSGIDYFDDQHLILATLKRGIGFFNKEEKTFGQFYGKTSELDYALSNDNIMMVYTDPDKVVWADIPNYSVEYTAPIKIKFKKNDSINRGVKLKDIISIFELSDGNIWVGTQNSNYMLNADNEVVSTIDYQSHPILKDKGMLYHFEDQDQRVWILCWGHLFYYDLQRNSIHKVSFDKGIEPSTLLYGSVLNNGMTVFSSFTGGMFKLKAPNAKELVLVPIENVEKTSTIPIFYQGEDNLIYANENLNQMIVFDENFIVQKKIPIASNYNSFYEEPGDSILWIGTDKGLVRYHKQTEKFNFVLENKSSLNAQIIGIVQDKDVLWLSTNKGIVQFYLKDFSIKNFNLFDGIASTAYNKHAYHKNNEGEILFGSRDGITTFRPSDIHALPNLTQPQITDIKINDEIYLSLSCADSIGVTNVSEINALQLEYSENTISFEFAAMDYSGDPSHNKYKYKIIGIDDNWIDAGNKNFARYANLPGGHYEFQVLAANSDGAWTESPRKIKIEIIPLLIDRWWFRGLLGLLALALIAFGVKAYEKIKYDKQIALEKQKMFWAKKMHDDLGADYSSLKLRLGMLAAKLKNNPDPAIEKDTNRIIETSETISKQIRGITWSLNLKNDSLDKLINFLQEYSTKLFEDTETDIEFPLPDDIPEKELKGEVRMTVLHVFKEVLNNAQKHAQAKNVLVEIQNDSKSTTIIIKDDGIGFDPKLLKQSTGNGLINIQDRMREINGRGEIQTSPSGTIVHLSFPI